MAAKDADLVRDFATDFVYLNGNAVAAFEIELSAQPQQVDGDRNVDQFLVGVDYAAFEIEVIETPHATEGVSPPPIEPAQKSQFISAESLDILLHPFISSTGSLIVSGLDVITLTLKAPDAAIYNPTVSWDPVVSMWVAQLDVAEFQEGEWLLYGVSDVASSLPQFMSLWWGDYMDDIPETRQAALGRWKIEGATLRLYEENGTTVFKEFSLKDDAGDPTSTKIFDKDPV